MTTRCHANSIAEKRELHDLCWQFEEAWQNGMKPRVQDWLGKAQLVQRGILLEELLQTETELRHLSDQESQQFISEEDTLRQVDPSETKPTELTWTDDGRYQFINEIARGGAGAVWRVFDHRLDRYSAIKILLDSQDNAEMRGRFEQEARISARLQHPGIVPVHELSQLGDGRPFVSMKLIEGKTLGEILASSKSQTQSNLLDIFVKACEAMAYAHEQNIIHRDLKPSNIMVGAFNEVQVMDWGLAKELKSGQVESPINQSMRSSHVSDRNQTLVGSVFGTIAYMPPEQARGDVDRIDKRSDVFALGGILCSILTGLPVYDGSDTDKLLGNAQSGSVSPAVTRIRKSRARSSLKTLAIDCISAEPENRPRDAREVQLRLSVILKPSKRMHWLRFALAVVGVSVAFIIGLLILDFYLLTTAEIIE